MANDFGFAQLQALTQEGLPNFKLIVLDNNSYALYYYSECIKHAKRNEIDNIIDNNIHQGVRVLFIENNETNQALVANDATVLGWLKDFPDRVSLVPVMDAKIKQENYNKLPANYLLDNIVPSCLMEYDYERISYVFNLLQRIGAIPIVNAIPRLNNISVFDGRRSLDMNFAYLNGSNMGPYDIPLGNNLAARPREVRYKIDKMFIQSINHPNTGESVDNAFPLLSGHKSVISSYITKNIAQKDFISGLEYRLQNYADDKKNIKIVSNMGELADETEQSTIYIYFTSTECLSDMWKDETDKEVYQQENKEPLRYVLLIKFYEEEK